MTDAPFPVLGDQLRIPTVEELRAMPPKQRRELVKWATPRIVEEFFPVVPHPPQQLFLWMNNLEAFYGGAGGGGKSVALLLAALQYADVPGYQALILRRTYQDLSLPGALMDLARDLLIDTPAKPIDGGRAWAFPGGARLTFGYAQYHNEIYRYRSAAFQFCVERGTGILMADGSTRAIEAIRPGQWVATLEGPRPVTRVHHVGPCPAWRVATPQGEVVVGDEHRLLAADGWVSPRGLASQAGGAGPTCGVLDAPRRDGRRPGPWTPEDRPPWPGSHPLALGDMVTLGSSVWPAGEESDSGASGDECPAALPPRWLTVPVVDSVPRGDSRERIGRAPPGSPTGCRGGHRCDGGRSLMDTAASRGGTLRPGGAGEHSSGRLPDDWTRTPARSPARWWYSHPYTMAPVAVPEGAPIQLGVASMAPAGVADCWDLTVAGASHYITPSSGLIHANCAFDELTTFDERTYLFMFARLRRPAVPCLGCHQPLRRDDGGVWRHDTKAAKQCERPKADQRALSRYPPAPDGTTVFDVPLRMRSASNPGGPGHGFVRDRFVNSATRDPSTVFVPARLSDNPSLDAPTYLESLSHLDPVERARILDGDWSVTDQGKMFKRHWFPVVPQMPAGARARMVRYWDFAATEARPGKDPDWTVGALVGFHEGVWYVADMRRARTTPRGVEQLVAQTAIQDGRRVAIWVEQEPGASGKSVIDYYRRKVLPGFEVRGNPVSGSKTERARPVSAAAEAGNMVLVEGSWNRAFLDEAELFPTPQVHDDQIDSVSGAVEVMSLRVARLRA